MSPDLVERAQTIRVLALLDALARVGLVPTPGRALHELAYLANVLSPVFDLTPLDAKLLKRPSGPYYPELQHAIDRLVGRALVDATGLRYEYDAAESRYRIVAGYRLRRSDIETTLARHDELFPAESAFLRELASAYSALSDAQLGQAAQEDARFADVSVDMNNVIDFGEWESPEKNFTRNAAMSFAPDRSLLPAERLYLYLDHLARRVSHVG